MAYQKEIDGYGYGEHGYHGDLLAHAETDEGVEQKGLQEPVDEVGKGKAGAAFGGRLDAESEMGGGNVVEYEADGIACGVGQGGVEHVYQYQVHDVLYGYGRSSYDGESQKLSYLCAFSVI